MGENMRITAKMNHELWGYYSGARLEELYGTEGTTPREVAELKDGPWEDVPIKYRMRILWMVLVVKNQAGMRECLARMLERVLPTDCDSRGRAVIVALRGDSVTRNVVDAAYAAFADASDAYAAHMALMAANSALAGRAARAMSSAYAAAQGLDSELQAQIKDILEFLEKM